MKIDRIEQMQPGMLIQLQKDPLGFWSWPVRDPTIEVLVLKHTGTGGENPTRDTVSVLWGEEIYYLSIAGTVRGRTNWVFSRSQLDEMPKTWVYSIKLLARNTGTP